MTEILLRCLILSLTTIGICCTFWDDMIFDKAGDAIKKRLGRMFRKYRPSGMIMDDWGDYLAKPLFGCYVCATFWYSLVICLVVGWQWWLAIPAMGISAVIMQISKE